MAVFYFYNTDSLTIETIFRFNVAEKLTLYLMVNKDKYKRAKYGLLDK